MSKAMECHCGLWFNEGAVLAKLSKDVLVGGSCEVEDPSAHPKGFAAQRGDS